MKTIGEVLKLSTEYLKGKRRLAEELIAFTLGMQRMELYMQFDQPVEEKELGLLREPLKRLLKGEPIEYVLGVVEFGGCQIGVDSRVLIPRQETEILLEHVSKRLRGKVVWDVCTGSGCLGIALKKKRPELEVILSDISSIAVARENAARNKVTVGFVEGDLLEPFQGETRKI